jgi:transcriptional regulator with XRE-family HTH domain
MLHLVRDSPVTERLSENRLKVLRNASGMTRQDLADESGVDRLTIARWETGKLPIPEEYIAVLADRLGSDASFLMGWDRAESPAEELSPAEEQTERQVLRQLAIAIGEAALRMPAESKWRRACFGIRQYMLHSAANAG